MQNDTQLDTQTDKATHNEMPAHPQNLSVAEEQLQQASSKTVNFAVV